jgi:hypothetical protein
MEVTDSIKQGSLTQQGISSQSKLFSAWIYVDVLSKKANSKSEFELDITSYNENVCKQ